MRLCRFVPGFAAVVLVASCATTPTPAPSPTASADAVPTPSEAAPTSELPVVADVAVVTCTEAGPPSIAQPLVRPQPDGVHFWILHGLGRFLSLEFDGASDGLMVEAESQLIVRAIVPRDVLVRCEGEGTNRPPAAPLSIVDPLGVYRPATITATGTCGSLTIDYGPNPRGDRGDPLVIAREALSGLQPGDIVEGAGYALPDARYVRVVRRGNVVAVVALVADGVGGWLVTGGELCEGVALASG